MKLTRIEGETPLGASWAIVVDEIAVSVVHATTGALAWMIRWDEIDSVMVWKDDVFVCDIMCMGFAWRGSDVLKVVDEEMSGWNDLCAAIEGRLGVNQGEWWRNAAFPAFAANRAVIWKRS